MLKYNSLINLGSAEGKLWICDGLSRQMVQVRSPQIANDRPPGIFKEWLFIIDGVCIYFKSQSCKEF